MSDRTRQLLEAARAALAALPGSGARAAVSDSIIVPAHGRPEAACRLLEALCRQTVDPSSFEVIVVDDGSPEPLAGALKGVETPFPCAVVRRTNGGPAAARNTGLRRARGDMVIFLNDDAVPAPDLIAVHRRARATAPAHAAILGAFPYSESARESRFVRLAEARDLVFPFRELRSDRPLDWVFFWTCNISVPREDVIAVGGFDERFRHAMAEDIELGWRMQRDLGTVVVHVPEAVCRHEHRITVAEFARRQHTMGWNHHLLYEKYDNPAPLALGGLGPFDERAFARLRESAELEREAHDAALAELESWEREPRRDLADAELRRYAGVAWRISATAFKRGVCDRHFHRDAGRTFRPREKDFLGVHAGAGAASRRIGSGGSVQVPI